MGFFDKIKEVLLEPAFDVIKNIAGGVWDGVKAVVDKIKGWFAAAKDVAGRVWNWVKGKLGISDDGPGLWDWIKEKASEAWVGRVPALIRRELKGEQSQRIRRRDKVLI